MYENAGYSKAPPLSEKREARQSVFEISVSDVKKQLGSFAVNADDLSDGERAKERRDIFDNLSRLSPIELESLIPLTVSTLDAPVRAVRAEIKQAQRASVDLLECPEFSDDGKRIIWTTTPEGAAKGEGRLADEVFDALCVENQVKPFLFDCDGWLSVRDGTERISPVDSETFRSVLADKFDWWRVINSERHGIYHMELAEMPAVIAKRVETHKARHVRFPRLERVVNRPLLNSDGTFATRRGYASDLKSYILSDFQIEKMSLEKACEVLTEPFSLFPFADQKDRATAFAYLFTLLLRERLGAHVPYFHFGAARQGTGKGLLCRSMFYIVEGREIAHATYYRDEERLVRSVSSFLLGGAPGILFDNVADGYLVSNPFLEMVATAPVVSLRVLYQTLEREVPVNAVICFTGNNLSFDSGLRRRVQHCYLESDLERPELRENLPNLKESVRTKRLNLLSAALSIIHRWVDIGCPQKNINLGSYETWSNTIAAVLEIAGIEGFQPMVREMSDRDVARRVFVRAVWEKFQTQEWGVKETLLIASNGTDETPGDGVLSEFLTGNKSHYPARLGYVLRTFANQVFEYEDERLILRVERVEGVSPVKYYIKNLSSDVEMVGF